MKGRNSGIKMAAHKRSKSETSSSQAARLKCIQIISIICWSFPLMFAVKQPSSDPPTKLTLVLLAKYTPSNVKMGSAMTIMVSVQ
jgi:hypothetical protein